MKFLVRSSARILVVTSIGAAAACTEAQFGTGPVPAFADASAPAQVDASSPIEAGTATSACARAAASRVPETCDEDSGAGPSATCPAGVLASGSVFGIVAPPAYASCAEAGAVACSAGKAFGLNESHDFQGWCVCGAAPGAACSTDAECSNLHCNADKKCGALANEACTPLGPSEIALLPETECRTTCSRTTCTCEPACKVDADCGGPFSGRICNAASTCVGGCRGSGGNGCASSFDHCSSRTSAVGICTDAL